MFQIILCSFCVIFFVSTYKVEVNLKQGKLIGTQRLTIFDGNIYYAFYGVPYAKPPIGKLRFKDPEPPKKWVKSYDARTEYHGACAQSHIVHKHGLYGYEDCLHLNIYTPSIKTTRKLKAVIVWIHGYAFTSSFSHIHGPDFFLDNDVIFISLTHRIGPFGFLKINNTDSHANMGLKDIIMALKWIKKNIKAFNGDHRNITVMGSGSAATLIALLSTTKHSKLFSQMILQSGALHSPSLFQGDYALEKDRLENNLKKLGYKSIRTAPTKSIVEGSNKIYSTKEIMNKQIPLIPFLPFVEIESNKSLITKDPKEYLQRANIRTKRILIGFNSQESISEVIPFLHNPHYLKAFASHFKFMIPFAVTSNYSYTTRTYDRIGEKIRNAYFKDGISDKSTDDFLRYTSDLIKYPIYHFIQNYLQNRENTAFVYKFNYIGKFNAVKHTSVNGLNIKVRGAASGDEICYIMKCEPLWENYVKLKDDHDSQDRLFIKQLTQMWANFAKAGDPTPNAYKGNVTWPPTTLQNDNVLQIGKKIHMVDTKKEKRMYRFWNDIYSKFYENYNGHDEL